MKTNILSRVLAASLFLILICPSVAFAQCLMPLKLVTPVAGAEVTTLTPELEVNFDPAINDNPNDCFLIGAHWIVTTDSDMLNRVVDFETDGIGRNPVSVMEGALELNRTFYWSVRVRFNQNGNQHYSMFAPPRSFKTVLPRLDIPPIQLGCTWPEISNAQPSEGVENVSINPELRISLSPSDPNNGCEIAEATWRLTVFCYCPDPEVLFETGFEPVQLNRYQVVENVLDFDMPYKWYVKYKTFDGEESEWLGPHIFRTMARPVGDPPPFRGAGDFCALDLNGDFLIDDAEFFSAIDLWVNEQMDNDLFFEVVDAWINQDEICPIASSGNLPIKLQLSSNSFIVQSSNHSTESISIEIFDINGAPIDSMQSAGHKLRWNMQTRDLQPLANGVYLYRVFVKQPNGVSVISDFRKILVLR